MLLYPVIWVGHHTHPAPAIVGASHAGFEKLSKIITDTGGAWTSLQLLAGIKGKVKLNYDVYDLDPAFRDRSYLSKVKRKVMSRLTNTWNKKVTGSSTGPNSIDGCFQAFKDFATNTKNPFLYKSEPFPEQYICIASEEMQDLLRRAPNCFVRTP